MENFCRRICGLTPKWTPKQHINNIHAWIKAEVGAGKVLVAVSGGVDSSVTAVLLARILGKQQLCCVYVNNGLLRENEAAEIINVLRELKIEPKSLNCQSDFLNALRGVIDAEEKRQIIGHEFVRQLEAFARGKGFTHLAQGTLKSDVIESGVGEHTQRIKSHHNVGGLPAEMELKLLEPLRELFKDEVRALGKELGLSAHILQRQPFPGPGLAVRIIGENYPATSCYVTVGRHHLSRSTARAPTLRPDMASLLCAAAAQLNWRARRSPQPCCHHRFACRAERRCDDRLCLHIAHRGASQYRRAHYRTGRRC